jgi:D-xylose transport system substrate-binding protein
LKGYQCGTVYKPIFVEAQAAAAVALYLRAGQTPPASLVAAKSTDPSNKKEVPSVFLKPIWVTTDNMNDTVIHDQAVKVSDICTPQLQQACSQAGIK